jgi:glucosamine--fructose-6-phosphate aminotransferase (isomerizing)
MENGTFTRQEIFSQPEAWASALELLGRARREVRDLDPAGRFDQILFTGCGSTYYLALAAASLAQELTGRPCRAFPASELWFHPGSAYPDGPSLLVAVSRSGETTETLRACEAFLGDRRGELVTLTCYADMPLAGMGGLDLVLPSGQERSVAQTRAFSTLYLGTVALALLWAGREDLLASLGRLPEAGRRVLEAYAPLAAELGSDPALDRFYWLGSGPRYGLACELSLKMKEMSLSHSEPFHFLEFRHGPKSMLAPSALVIGLRSSRNGAHEAAVLEEVKSAGSRLVDMAESGTDVRLDSGLDEAVRNVLYLPFGQLVAFERALSKGLDPDRPTNLDSVVKLKEEEA